MENILSIIEDNSSIKELKLLKTLGVIHEVQDTERQIKKVIR